MNRIQQLLSLVGVAFFLAGIVVTVGVFDLPTPGATQSSGSPPTTAIDGASSSDAPADRGTETVANSDSEITQDDENRETGEELQEREEEKEEEEREKEREEEEDEEEEEKEEREEETEEEREEEEEDKEDEDERDDEGSSDGNGHGKDKSGEDDGGQRLGNG